MGSAQVALTSSRRLFQGVSMKDERTPNDQRSDVKNPNNGDHKQNRDNRADQLNPNHQKSKDQDHPMKQGSDAKK